VIVLLAGLPGAGKSTLGNALAERLHGVVLNKDTVRAALFPAPLIEYSTGQDDFCVRIMLQVADYLLARDPALPVFIDGRVFAKYYQIAEVRNAAAALHTPFHVIECVCSDEAARERLQRDALAGAHPAKNRDFLLYQRLRESMEPVPDPKLVIDTEHRLDDCVAHAMAYLSAAR
jgi:predicted kinase